jgi:uncharacterized protein (TIGR02284 family)
MDNKAIEVMNGQIQLDRDAILAYDEAIEACEMPEIKRQLGEFRGDHERHVRDLSEVVKAFGGKPPEKRDLKGYVIQGFTKVMSRGDRSALLAMRGNEELTNRSYEAALKRDLPPEVRSLLERNLTDERRHLAWIKDAISARAWDREEGARPPAPHP